MGIRIKDMTPQPKITDGDYFVIDGEDGTRKVPVENLLVLTGTSSPSANDGVDGEMYAQISSGKISGMYVKLPTYGWQPTPVGGSYFKEFTITERDVSTSTFRVYETPPNS